MMNIINDERLSHFIDKQSLTKLLCQANLTLNEFKLDYVGYNVEIDSDDCFLSLLVPSDSSCEDIVKCDIALTYLTVQFKMKNNLNGIILCCEPLF